MLLKSASVIKSFIRTLVIITGCQILPKHSVSQIKIVPQNIKTTIIKNVNIVPMDTNAVLRGRTVTVEYGIITKIDSLSNESLSSASQIIEGKNMYLLPGLTDAHVHLDEYVGARPDFGDAPIYLSYGITTVFNLRGDKTHLEWKRKIINGSLVAPNLYTSGEFVNEPRVNTADDAEREVLTQKNEGYDIIKFREVIDFEKGMIATTTGMEHDAYLKLNESARKYAIPLVGHAPYRVGLNGLIEAGQSLAHTNELANLYFLPPFDFSSENSILTARWIFLALFTAMLIFSFMILVYKLIKHTDHYDRYLVYYQLFLLFFSLLTGGTAIWIMTESGGMMSGNFGLLLILCAFVILSVFVFVKVWRYMFQFHKATDGYRTGKALMTLLLIGFFSYMALLAWWTPHAWRSSDWVIRSVAKDLKSSGIFVQSTLVLYETGIGRKDGYKIDQLKDDPVFSYMPKPMQEGWKKIPGFLPDWMSFLWQCHPDFTRRLVTIMHEEGVPIMAGTDAMGVPLVLPGTSMHKELELLRQSGLSNYEVLRTATVIPARFIHREKEFGTVAPGLRADLILVDKNPLVDLSGLRQPVGVMVRGQWLSREKIDTMMADLKE